MRWLCLLLALSGCDSGPFTLGRELAGSEEEAEPLPWFGGPDYYADWPRGYPSEPAYFPLGVWMQNPDNAQRFAVVGINHFVGLWQGPTDEQLATARAANMPVVCDQAGAWQDNLPDPNIRGWLHPDGPDNAQLLEDGSYGPCVPPAETKRRYREMVAAEPSRPVVVLLGQGVAIPDWVGRGECAGQTADYPGYAESADILVNYTYPLANENPLELVATGIDNLNRYANYEKPVFADIEASSIHGMPRPTPHQLRAEVWMSLIHGAAGIQYFCHRMEPLNETDCLDDAETAASLARINAELTALAPVLNSQSYSVRVQSSDASVPVRAVLKRAGKARYLFAAGMAGGETSATFSVPGVVEARVEVLGEDRYVTVQGGFFRDDFAPYDVHLYRFEAP